MMSAKKKSEKLHPEQKFEGTSKNSSVNVVQGLPLNPGSKKNMKLVIERVKQITNIGNQKFSVLVVDGSPHGMIINDILKGEEYTKNLVTVEGIFHSHKEFMSIVLNAANDFDEGILGSLGFDCEKKRERVIHCSDVHKSFDVVNILATALGKEMVVNMMETDSCTIDSLTSDGFLAFLNRKRSKDGFLCWLYLKFAALVAMKEAIRTADFDLLEDCLYKLDDVLFLAPKPIYSKIRAFVELRSSVLTESGRATFLQMIRDVSLMQTKNGGGERFQPTDAILEELNRVLKRIVADPTLEEWMRKSACFQKLKVLNENARANLLIKEDFRDERCIVTHLSDDLKLREHVRSNFGKIDGQHGIFKQSGGKKFIRSGTELEVELQKRKGEFGKEFKNGMLNIGEGNKVKVSTKTIPPITFKNNVRIVNDDSDDDDADGDFVPEGEEIATGVNNDVVDMEDESILTHQIVQNGGIFVAERLRNRLCDPSAHCFCCVNRKSPDPNAPIICGKRLIDDKGVGECCECDAFFYDDECGVIFIEYEDPDNPDNTKYKKMFLYCKRCLSTKLKCCVCNQHFVLPSSCDICNICWGRLLHDNCGSVIEHSEIVGRRNVTTSALNACPVCVENYRNK